MKRLISFALTLALALSLLPAACAASDEAIQAAESLNALGLFGGVGNNADGTPNFDLDRAPTRQEAITMLVRLLGKEEEAKAGTWETPFVDVDDWAKPYVGYAYANKLGGGTSPTTFSGNDPVTATQYLTFILRALGYQDNIDFQWDKAWELSDKIELTDGRYNAETATFTRGDVAIISNDALSTAMKGKEESLAQNALGIAIASEETPIAENTPEISTGVDGVREIWQCERNAPSGNGTIYYEFVFYDNDTLTYVCYLGDKDTGKVASQESSWYIEYYTGTYEKKDWYYNKNDDTTYYTLVLTPQSGQEASSKNGIKEISSSSNRSCYFRNTEPKENSFTCRAYESLYTMTVATVSKATRTTYIKEWLSTGGSDSDKTNPDLEKDYSYLAAADFRSVRRDYSQAVAQCAYAQAFIDLNGDLCVLTHVRYKIISNFSVTTLHNLTKGTTIAEPADYYAGIADRLYGYDRIKYNDLRKEVLTVTVEMLEAMTEALTTGNNPGKGNYVDAETLNR